MKNETPQVSMAYLLFQGGAVRLPAVVVHVVSAGLDVKAALPRSVSRQHDRTGIEEIGQLPEAALVLDAQRIGHGVEVLLGAVRREADFVTLETLVRQETARLDKGDEAYGLVLGGGALEQAVTASELLHFAGWWCRGRSCTRIASFDLFRVVTSSTCFGPRPRDGS